MWEKVGVVRSEPVWKRRWRSWGLASRARRSRCVSTVSRVERSAQSGQPDRGRQMVTRSALSAPRAEARIIEQICRRPNQHG